MDCVGKFAQEAQARLLIEVVDAILEKVFQGKRNHLRMTMLDVAGKVSRKHPWPFFEEVVEAEVERRIAGQEAREWFIAAGQEALRRRTNEFGT